MFIPLDEGSSARVVGELFNTDNCEYIDFIETSSVLVMTLVDSYNDARNRTARLDGNYILNAYVY
jgi:hypothetical protein